MVGKRLQFDLRAMLCGMIAISLGLAYLRSLHPDYALSGLYAAAAALLLGTLVGMVTGRVADAQFWAVLGGTFAMISAVGVVAYHWIWAVTGAVAGAAIGSTAGGPWLRTVLAGSVATTAAFAVCVAPFRSDLAVEVWLDLLAAPVIGALFGLLVEIFCWLERRSTLPRHVTAIVLMAAVCAGNYFAR
jgi:hypothetical protein